MISSKTDKFAPESPSKLFIKLAPSPAVKPPASTSKFIVLLESQLLVGANLILLSVATAVGKNQSVAVAVRDKS